MIIKQDQLASQFTKPLLPLYWVSGDEPLLTLESADLIRQQCRDKGFADREVFDIEKDFNWSLFLHATNNLSLFSEQKIFELRLSSAKLDDAGKKAIAQYLDAANPDYVVLLSGPQMDSSSLKTKWFREIEAHAVFIQIWKIDASNLPSWLNQRLRNEGIRASTAAVKLLAEKVEGNLLAAVQEIEKFKLLVDAEPGKQIEMDENAVIDLVADSSHYSVFNLVDAALAGRAERAIKILTGLENDGSHPLPILGALTREIRSLIPMLEKVQQGQSVNSVIQSARVWFNRKQAVTVALQRLNTATLWQLLDTAREIDFSIKGLNLANSWDELATLVLKLSGVRTATMN